MDWFLLAQSELGDWLQAILVILLVAGSAFAAIAKKLIEYFGGAKADDSSLPGEKRVTPPTGQKPHHPVARPMPPRRPPATQGPGPVARPFPARPTAQARPPVVQEHPPLPRVPSSSVRTRPPTQPTIHEGLPSEKPSVVGPVREVHPHLPSDDLEGARVSARAHEGLPSEVRARQRKARREDLPSGRRVSLAPLTEEAAEEAAVDQDLGHFTRHPTREELRRAIVMNEILGPPVALRPFEERS